MMRRLRARVDLTRQRLAEIKATRDAGRLKLAMTMAAALVAETQRIDYPPVQAEAQAMQGELETVAGDPKRAEAMLEQAFYVAEAAHDDDLKAEPRPISSRRSATTRGATRTPSAGSGSRRRPCTGSGATSACKSGSRTTPRSSTTCRGATRRRWPPTGGPTSCPRRRCRPRSRPGPAAGKPGHGVSAAGRPAEGLGYNERAVAILRKALGPGHPEVVMHMSNRGEILNALGRYREARELFTTALASWAKELPPDHPYVAIR